MWSIVYNNGFFCGNGLVEAFLRSNQYPVNVGNDKGKKANFRRKCRSFVIHDDCVKFVHKPNKKDMTGEYCFIQ